MTMDLPPLTVAWEPLAVLEVPPLTVELDPEAWFHPPPLTAEGCAVMNAARFQPDSAPGRIAFLHTHTHMHKRRC